MGEPWPRGLNLPPQAMPVPGEALPLPATSMPAASFAPASLAAASWTPASVAAEPTAMPGAGSQAEAALLLYARVLGAATPEAAAHALVSSLAHEGGYARVTLGLHERGRTRLLASSSMDVGDAQAELPLRLVGAMDEALDQGQSLAWPRSTSASVSESRSGLGAATPAAPADPICHEHGSLHALVGAVVATVPLGHAGEPFAALCVERAGDLPIDAAELRALESKLALAAPALRWMQQGTESWHRRMRRDWAGAREALRRPEARGRRRWVAALALSLLFIAAVPLDREVGGRARVEGAEQRVLAAPADGFVKIAHVRPGDRVKAGDALVDLVEADLRLERERWASQLAQHENAYAAAMARSERSAVSTSLSRISEAQAQLALVDEQLLRGRVTAPFDALVIQGDLSQAIGTPVRQGDTLMTLATSGRYRVIVEVDESDIALVQPGQTGQLVLSSLQWGSEALRVERITPLARAVDGRNVFEVEASLPAPSAELRPGLLGRAELLVGRQPPLWGWIGHAIDRIRLAWWAWLG